MDFFRKIFNFSDKHSETTQNDQRRYPRDSIPYEDEPHDNRNRNFQVFTDPLEMHRYFEQQMDDFFKSFGFPNFGNFFPSLEAPNIEEHFYDEEKHVDTNSREYFLKNPSKDEDKIDRDLDGKLSITDIDKFFNNENNKGQQNVMPKRDFSPGPFQNRFFNQSVQVRTVRQPDGSVETHRTVRDSEGNEETTVTRKMGEKEYTIIKKRDKEGKEEIHENMINMTEQDKPSFFSDTPLSKSSFYESLLGQFFK
ncbi:hypothetical protein ABEB36_011774 [Hypothenemus hampei]|uniref:HCLS1-associated protein X-1 n=1 Tax=Hypothenemus hampei TaxID=57062 RepID=A0ABD1EB17_HYPHA